MDFRSFQVLIPVLSDIAHFDFMPEQKDLLIFPIIISLHKNVCKFKFCVSVLLALRTCMSLCSQQTAMLYQSVLNVLAFLLSVAVKFALMTYMHFSEMQAGDKCIDFAYFEVYTGLTWTPDFT